MIIDCLPSDINYFYSQKPLKIKLNTQKDTIETKRVRRGGSRFKCLKTYILRVKQMVIYYAITSDRRNNGRKILECRFNPKRPYLQFI